MVYKKGEPAGGSQSSPFFIFRFLVQQRGQGDGSCGHFSQKKARRTVPKVPCAM